MKAWQAWILKSIGAVFLGISIFSLLAVILIFLLPGVQSSIVQKANDEYAPRMIPILLAYEPQLSTLTYDNTASYCRTKPPGVSMEFGGISDEYVCGLIENNYVSNTEELQLRLARELVSSRMGDVMAVYGPQLAGIYAKLPLAIISFIISLLLAFPFLYFGSKNLIEFAFNLFMLTAVFSFMALFFCALALFLLPPQIVAYAKSTVSTPLYIDLISASRDLISETIGELFLPPIIIFGLFSLLSGLCAAAFFFYLVRPRMR